MYKGAENIAENLISQNNGKGSYSICWGDYKCKTVELNIYLQKLEEYNIIEN